MQFIPSDWQIYGVIVINKCRTFDSYRGSYTSHNSEPIWIQTVWQPDGVLENIYFKNFDFEKTQQTTKYHA